MLESEFQEVLPTKLSTSTSGQPNPFNKDSEFWEFLLLIGFGNASATKELYKSLSQQISQEDWRRPILEIGKSRYLSVRGQDFESYRKLEIALSQSSLQSKFPNNNIQDEIFSLYNYVLSTLNSKISNQLLNLPMLFGGKQLTKNQNFILAYNFQIALNQVEMYNYPISYLVSAVKTLEKAHLKILACMGHRVIGGIARERKQFTMAHKYFDSAMSIARHLNLGINIKQILMNRAFAYYSQNKVILAEKTLLLIKPDRSLDPILPLLNENLALIAKQRDEMDLSASLVKSALNISTRLDSVSRLPGECEYLGDIYENHFKDYEQAEYYYKLGYDHSMRYASHGISLTGDRKKAVEAYTNFISRKNKSSSQPSSVSVKDPFSFAQGKTWLEIKDTFQHQLLLYHGKTTRISKLLAKKLEMPASTLYSLQDRLKERGYSLPAKEPTPQPVEHELQSFLMDHQELSWTAVNKIFEREMIHYLYEKYGYNKHRMASILKISYPSIISKTRELTQVNRHFLQN